MKERILHILRLNGPLRQRSIASLLDVWTADPDLIHALHTLKKEGRVKEINHHDPANMEWYSLWEIRKEG